ncbi:MAG TPA: ABC transporter substrate-binding protein [Pseudolabrys sp.]|jgi:NitT/TauT family transport system substrate-binding protein|nr:ABC transporter substrate-binding protein [Pseudolabrys sp.]
MKFLKSSVIVASALLSWSACAETVKITNIGHGYYAGALYIAKREKLFEKYGLEPDISYVQGGALALQSVLTKQADVSVLSYEHILTSAVQGKRIVAFFNIANRPVNNVIASDKLVAGSDGMSVEQKIKRLKGMRVAMPSAGGSGEKMLGVLAKKYGLTLPGDITSVYLGAEAPSYVAAFQRDLIDAALPFEPAGVLVQQAGKGKIYINMMNGEVPELRDILFMVLATNPDTMKEKPEVLRKVAAVFTEAMKILKTEPKRGKALMALEYPTMTPETNDQAYNIVSQIWTNNGKISEAQARATFAYLQPKGPQQVDFSSTFTNEFLPK